jgi:hypothetical protein
MSGHAKKEHKASKQDLIIMVMTFFVGIFAGFYLYTTAFAPEFDEFVGQTEEVYDDFVVEGTQYGGDRMGGAAPSFQLLENGSYRYLPYVGPDEVAEAQEGSIPRALLNEVKQVLTTEALEIASGPVVRGDCMSYVDGLDYTYDVTLDGVNYTLDTCTTALTASSLVSTTLDKLWNYFATLE